MKNLPKQLLILFSSLIIATLLSGCTGAATDSGDSGAVTGVSTPSKVSVVNTN